MPASNWEKTFFIYIRISRHLFAKERNVYKKKNTKNQSLLKFM